MEDQHFYQFDIQGNQLTIKRSYNGSLAQVWRAYTDAEILDLWWAPKPWKCETKYQDFVPGGTWLYAMKGPENETHWSIFKYNTINFQESFSGTDAFTDEQGHINTSFPQSNWNTSFEEKDNGTLVTNICTFENEDAMNQLLEMGFKEGYEMGQSNLDALLNEGF